MLSYFKTYNVAYGKRNNTNAKRNTMEMRLNIREIPDLLFEYGTNYILKEDELIEENHFDFEYSGFKANFNEIVLQDFRISYGNGCLGRRARLDFDYAGETVEMHFTLKGNSRTTIDGHIKEHVICGSGHNLFYCKDIKGHLLWDSPEMFVFEVNLKPDFFGSYLPNASFFEGFKNAIHNGATCHLHPDNYPITPQMTGIIQEIMHCDRKGIFKKMFLESKVMELLLLQLEQMNTEETSKYRVGLKRQDVDKIYAVKEMLDLNHQEIGTLLDLAKSVGTNECTLKKGFKSLFGISVFQYWKSMRLETAKKLLSQDEMSVQEVANQIGYKNPQHFTAAFKKQYGMVPSALLNRLGS